MNLSFIKLDINIMNDTKIKIIRKMPDGDSILVLWIGLLCLGMKSGRPGIIEVGDGIPFNEESLSIELDIPINTVKLGLDTFERFKMIEVWENGEMYLTNFEKFQSLDKILDIKEKSRESSKRYREKKKAELLLEQTNNLCAYCGGYNELAEHIIPISKNGLNVPENTVPACKRCNSHKGAMDVSEFLNSNNFIDIERVLSTPNLMNLLFYENNKFKMNDITVTSLSLTVTESDDTDKIKTKIILEEEKKRIRIELEKEFNKFWNMYDKKSGRKKCLPKWKKLKDVDKEKIFQTLPTYIKSTPDKQYRKNPSTYLNNESWNDEVTINDNQDKGMKKDGFTKEYYEGNKDSSPGDFENLR